MHALPPARGGIRRTPAEAEKGTACGHLALALPRDAEPLVRTLLHCDGVSGAAFAAPASGSEGLQTIAPREGDLRRTPHSRHDVKPRPQPGTK